MITKGEPFDERSATLSLDMSEISLQMDAVSFPGHFQSARTHPRPNRSFRDLFLHPRIDKTKQPRYKMQRGKKPPSNSFSCRLVLPLLVARPALSSKRCFTDACSRPVIRAGASRVLSEYQIGPGEGCTVSQMNFCTPQHRVQHQHMGSTCCVFHVDVPIAASHAFIA